MRRGVAILLAVVALFLPLGTVATANTPAGAPDKIVVPKFGSTAVGTAVRAPGPNILGPLSTEIQKPKRLGSSPLRAAAATGDAVPLAPGQGSPTTSASKTKSNPELNLSFESVSHKDSRLAFGGNQFSGEPADMGVCAGNGYVLSSVNSALRVYSAATGAPISPVLSLNEFYGFPPAINRSTGVYGPFTFDISCHYDPDTNRWFHLAVDLDQDPLTGAFNGKNYLDLAVSTSGDPTGKWHVYRIPGMNDGTEGTPDHNCPGGPCFADFPHIGVDKYGVYISTNEFPLFEDGFTGAQVYAISKRALVSGAASIDAYLFDTSQPAWQVAPGQPGFTLWPALSAGKQFARADGGTNFFVSSNAVFTNDGASEEIIVWALSNTSSLAAGSPSPRLSRTVVPSTRYAVPPSSPQKPGTIPLGEAVYGATQPGVIDTSDSRVLDARYANDKLWAVLGTAAEVSGQQRAGVGWFILDATVASGGGVSAAIRKQGILALAGESLAYPTLGVTTSGRGVIGFSRVGETLHPSVGYASIDALAGVGPVHMIREGRSPQDGFTEYGGRPRWGDYGAAAVDGGTVYLASQYIEAPPCTVAEFLATTCNGTRTQLANWTTRVSKLTP